MIAAPGSTLWLLAHEMRLGWRTLLARRGETRRGGWIALASVGLVTLIGGVPIGKQIKALSGGTDILVATPSDAVRDGPYVSPKGPYAHIQAAKGRPETMMWAVERPDGGRGFGFTGGHFHLNWQNDDQRRLILNALVWLAKLDVPVGGVVGKPLQSRRSVHSRRSRAMTLM